MNKRRRKNSTIEIMEETQKEAARRIQKAINQIRKNRKKEGNENDIEKKKEFKKKA